MQAIKLDPSSYQGYKWRHAALHRARRYMEAAETFHIMLLKLEESPYEHIRGELFPQYHSNHSLISVINDRTSLPVC